MTARLKNNSHGSFPAVPQSWQGEWLAVPSLIAFATFAWMPLSYYQMVAWPWILIWQGSGLALLGWGLWQLGQHHCPFRLLGHGLDWVVAGFGVVLLLSTLLTEFSQVAILNTSLVIGYGWGLYVYRNWLGNGWLNRYRLWAGLVLVATVTAVISLVLWQPNWDMWRSQAFADALRNPQPLGHHNFVGGYFTLSLPLTVAGVSATQGWRRWLTVGSASVILVALYASGSRGAALGCLVWLAVTWLGVLARPGRLQQHWRWGGLLGLGVGLLALASNPRIRTGLASLLAGNWHVADSPTLDRWFMLRLGIHILQDRPLLGVGPGVMSRVSNLYRPIEAGGGLDHIQQLHNTPLQLAGELGIAGLVLSGVGLVLLGRLGWMLWQKPLSPVDRALLGGIGGSGLAYGVSSLTDYQLENIPIAGTLLGLGALLLGLAADYLPAHPGLSPAKRRPLRLLVGAGIGLVLCVWLPFTLSVGFGSSADAALQQNQLTVANSRWSKAMRLSPWEPTAAAVASEDLVAIAEMMGRSELRDDIQDLILQYAQAAQQAAPNDVWFNQNLAVLYQSIDPTQSLQFAARAVQLLPRHHHHGYFLLGELLLAQGQPSKAIAAFTLESLVRPEILLSPIWQVAPLQALYADVLGATIAEYDQLLKQVAPGTPGYQSLYEAWVLLTWWAGHPPLSLQIDQLRPVLQVLLLAETDPQAALRKAEAMLASDQASAELRLLAAWLAPDTHWSAYEREAGLLPASKRELLQQSLSQRDLRAWLMSIQSRPSQDYRVAMAFAYRNAQASQITQMLAPNDLWFSTLVKTLALFQPWPREFPPLDRHIEKLRTDALGLPHPTHHQFQLSPLPCPTC